MSDLDGVNEDELPDGEWAEIGLFEDDLIEGELTDEDQVQEDMETVQENWFV